MNVHHKENWVQGRYLDIVRFFHKAGPLQIPGSETTFRFLSVEMRDQYGKIAAGEIGYLIGSVYTSLTGFFDRNSKDANNKMRYSGAGTVQLVGLGLALKEMGVKFWNLGHPFEVPKSPNDKGEMMYKADLGCRIVDRAEFLKIWYEAVDSPLPRLNLSTRNVRELISLREYEH